MLTMTPIVKIIDLKEFRKSTKTGEPFQAISSGALNEIHKAVNDKKRIIIFINRRGLATSIICQECGFVFKCPNCDIPLCYHKTKKKAELICHHCGYTTFMPLVCPICKGYKLKPLGVGIERIGQEIEKFITPLPCFSLIEGEMPDEQELDIFDKFNKGQIKILIGTEALFRPQLKPADLVIVISIDPILFLPDYFSEERVFFYLLKLKTLSKEKLIIQTLIPENKLFQYFIKNKEKKFLQEEKKWREQYLWPPYVQLIKLTLFHKEQVKGAKEAEQTKRKLDEEIKKLIPKNLQKNFIILGPAPSFIFREKGFYKWNILIKYKYFESKIRQDINPLLGLNFLSPVLTKRELTLRNKILRHIPSVWKIDVDPVDTL